MSVLASLRGETGVDYVDNAIKLSGFTKNTCKKLIPKGYTFYGGTQICDTAIRVASHAIQANSIYATNKAEARLRKEQLLLARAALKDLVAQVASMFEAIHFEMKLLRWIGHGPYFFRAFICSAVPYPLLRAKPYSG